jgi:hypothetical protein
MLVEEHCRALLLVRGLVRGCQQPDREDGGPGLIRRRRAVALSVHLVH